MKTSGFDLLRIALNPMTWAGLSFALALVAVGLLAHGTFPGLAYAAGNPIVIENQQPGSSGWQLTLSRASDGTGQIKGYASATSVNKGESLTFYITVNPAQSYTIDIYRIGWYQGNGGRFLMRIGPISGSQQPACPINATTGLTECGWAPAYTLIVPTTWTSGIYLAVLTNSQNYQNYVDFVIRDDSRVAALLYQQSVTTYQAYNNYPNNGTGKSLYEYNSAPPNTLTSTTRAVKVSFDRPYSNNGDGQFLTWEVYFVRWLERWGYDVTYSTDVDTHANGARLLNYRGFLSVGHDEYWSKPMFDAVQLARDSGVNLGFFGANEVFWQVRFEPSTGTAVLNRVMVCYKSLTLDPVQGSTTTVHFRDAFLNRPEQTLIGIQSTAQISNDIDQTVPYVVTNSSHWVYSGTGFNNGASVAKVVGYETDRYVSAYPLPAYVGSTYTLLSQSPLINIYNMSDYSNSSIYQAPSGAWVFAAGTISWAWALDKAGIVDPRMQTITANILNQFISAGGSTVPNAPSGLGGTAISSSQINLTWTSNSTNETNMIVERALSSAFTSITSFALPAGTTSFIDTGLAAATTYYYRVKAINGAGSSPYSNVASATTAATQAVSVSTVYIYDGQLRNNWGNWSYSGNVNFSSTSVAVYPGTTASISFQPTGAWGAVDFGSNSGPFNTAGYSSIVFAVQATQANQQLAVFFDSHNAPFKAVSLNNYGSPPQGVWKLYTIPLADLGASNTSVREFAVQDWSGTTGPLFYVSNVLFSGAGGSTVPNAPSGLGATAISSSQINLTWASNSTNETNMIVERALTSAFTSITSFALPAGTISFSDTGLAAATTYYYRVKAINGAGSSPYSNVASATTAATQTVSVSTAAYIYDGQLRNNWVDWSYTGNVNFSSTSIAVYPGTTASISFQPTGAWGAVDFGNVGLFNTTGYSSIVFAVRATQANQQLAVFFNSHNAPFKAVSLNNYGSPPQGVWKLYTIPLADLGASNTSVREFAIQDWSGTTGPLFYVSNVLFQ